MERRLGRGFSALLPQSKKDEIKMCEISKIKPSKFQARKNFDKKSLEKLAQSIREVGIIEPLVVRKIKEDTYELVCGERRLRAAKMAGFTKVPVIVKQISDREARELALIENLQREDLSPIECAIALEKLVELGYTHEQIAQKLGKSRSWVTNTIRLFSLPAKIRDLVDKGELSVGHAKVLLKLKDFPEKAEELAKQVVEKKLSVRELEQLVKQELDSKRTRENLRTQEIERMLSEKFEKAKVTVRTKNDISSIVIKIPEKFAGKFFEILKKAMTGG